LLDVLVVIEVIEEFSPCDELFVVDLVHSASLSLIISFILFNFEQDGIK
jgi:hypothetical protein